MLTYFQRMCDFLVELRFEFESKFKFEIRI